VFGVNFLLALKLGLVFVVQVFDGLVGYLLVDLLFQINLAGDFFLGLIDGALVFRSLEDVGGDGGLIQQFAVNIDFQCFLIKVVKGNLFLNLTVIFVTLFHFGDGNFFAVDDGGHAVFAGSSGIERIHHQQRERCDGYIFVSHPKNLQ